MKRSFPPVFGRRPRILVLGSLPGDASIRDERHNPILHLIQKTGVRFVFLNGAKAAAAFVKACPSLPDAMTIVALPSSSPANASIPLQRKMKAWQRIADALL